MGDVTTTDEITASSAFSGTETADPTTKSRRRRSRSRKKGEKSEATEGATEKSHRRRHRSSSRHKSKGGDDTTAADTTAEPSRRRHRSSSRHKSDSKDKDKSKDKAEESEATTATEATSKTSKTSHRRKRSKHKDVGGKSKEQIAALARESKSQSTKEYEDTTASTALAVFAVSASRDQLDVGPNTALTVRDFENEKKTEDGGVSKTKNRILDEKQWSVDKGPGKHQDHRVSGSGHQEIVTDKAGKVTKTVNERHMTYTIEGNLDELDMKRMLSGALPERDGQGNRVVQGTDVFGIEADKQKGAKSSGGKPSGDKPSGGKSKK